MMKLETYFTLIIGCLIAPFVSCDSRLSSGLNHAGENREQPSAPPLVQVRSVTFEDSTWVDSIIKQYCRQEPKLNGAALRDLHDTIYFDLISAIQPMKPGLWNEVGSSILLGSVVPNPNGTYSRTIQFLPPIFSGEAASAFADTLHYSKDAWYLGNGRADLHLRQQLFFETKSTDSTSHVVSNNIGMGENVEIVRRGPGDCDAGNIVLLKCEPTFTPIPKGSFYITYILLSEQGEIFGFKYSTHNNEYTYLRIQ